MTQIESIKVTIKTIGAGRNSLGLRLLQLLVKIFKINVEKAIFLGEVDISNTHVGCEFFGSNFFSSGKMRNDKL